MTDWAILVLRIVLGLIFVGHGTQKLFGWFGGLGYGETVRWLDRLGFRPARAWTLFVGGAELVGGVLFALGLLSPLGALAIIASRLLAIFRIHWPTLWAAEGGFEYPLLSIGVALAVAMTGPGFYSLDNWQNLSIPNSDVVVPWLFGLTVLAVFLGLAASIGPSYGQQTPAARQAQPKDEELRPAA